jgi:hypothetical protein
MSRTNTFYSLGVMPVLLGLGHLAPAVGAIQTATGSYHFPVRLLGLIGTISAVVDCKSYSCPYLTSSQGNVTNHPPPSYGHLQRSLAVQPACQVDMEPLGIWPMDHCPSVYCDVRPSHHIRHIPCPTSWSGLGTPLRPVVLDLQGMDSKQAQNSGKLNTHSIHMTYPYTFSSLKQSLW